MLQHVPEVRSFRVWRVFPYMYTVYLVYPFYSWRTLGLFSPLTIMTVSAINIYAKASVWIPVFSSSGCMHRSRVTGPHGLTGWRLTSWVYRAPASFHISTNNLQGYQFLHILTNLCPGICSFNYRQKDSFTATAVQSCPTLCGSQVGLQHARLQSI